VRHFFDPEKQIGKAIASNLNWGSHIAWNIYLFYDRGQKCSDQPPTPVKYAHQLTNEWADRHQNHRSVESQLELFLLITD
jgi:hypothetical protein